MLGGLAGGLALPYLGNVEIVKTSSFGPGPASEVEVRVWGRALWEWTGGPDGAMTAGSIMGALAVLGLIALGAMLGASIARACTPRRDEDQEPGTQ